MSAFRAVTIRSTSGRTRTSASFASSGVQEYASFPLYPGAVGALGRVFFGHYVVAGVLVSLAAALGSFLLLHRIADQRLGLDGGRRAVLYLAVFPMSLFLQAVYTE